MKNYYKITLAIIFIFLGMYFEHINYNNNSPLHTVPLEIINVLFPLLIYLNLYKNNYKVYYNILLSIAFLHLYRFIDKFNLIKKTNLKYNLFGLLSVLLLFNNKSFVISPFITIYCLYKMYNRSGFNFLNDIIITTLLLYYILSKKTNYIQNDYLKNYIYADTIYHILEIVCHFIIKR